MFNDKEKEIVTSPSMRQIRLPLSDIDKLSLQDSFSLENVDGKTYC